MKARTREMLDRIEEAHDWAGGQVYSGGGTEYHSTDTCRVCNLRWHHSSDSQHGVGDEYRFSDGETGADLSLRQAAGRECV